MFATTIRTYERKRKFGNTTLYTSHAVPSLYNNVKHGTSTKLLNNETEQEQNIHDISDYDPFDTTFDRLLKETKEVNNKPVQSLNYTLASRSSSSSSSNSDDSIDKIFRKDIITTSNLKKNSKRTTKSKKPANKVKQTSAVPSAALTTTKKSTTKFGRNKKRNTIKTKMTSVKCHISLPVRPTRNKYKLETNTNSSETNKLDNNLSCYVRLTKLNGTTNSIKENLRESHYQCNEAPRRNSHTLSEHSRSDERDSIKECKVILTKMDTKNVTKRKKCADKENIMDCFVNLTKINSLESAMPDISSSRGNDSSKLKEKFCNSNLSNIQESSMSNSPNKLDIDENSINKKYRKSDSSGSLDERATKKTTSSITESTRKYSPSSSSVDSKLTSSVPPPCSFEKLDLDQIDFAASNSMIASTPFIARKKIKNSLATISLIKAEDSIEETENRSMQPISQVSESDMFRTYDSLEPDVVGKGEAEKMQFVEKTNEIVENKRNSISLRRKKLATFDNRKEPINETKRLEKNENSEIQAAEESHCKVVESDLCDTAEITQSNSENESMTSNSRSSSSDSSLRSSQPTASRSLFSDTDVEENDISRRVDSDVIKISTANEKSTNLTESSMESDTCSLNEDLAKVSLKCSSISDESLRNGSKSMKRAESFDENQEIAITQRLTTNMAENASETDLKEEQNDFEKDVPIRKSLITSAISLQRRRYRGWDLTDISESVNGDEENNSYRKNESSSQPIPSSPFEKSLKDLPPSSSQPVTRGVFLKPGKNWMRSLSILGNIQNGHDLENLSKGKGRKWRQSVLDILNMQEDGILQSCLKDIDKDKECPSLYNRTKDRKLSSQRSTFLPASPNRFSRRFSIRIIPDTRDKKSIHDNSYLDVFTTQLDSHKESSAVISLKPTNERPERRTKSSTVVKTPRDLVLERCKQKDYLQFAECFPDQYLKHCQKIGEGVYGEVFLYDHQREKTVIKIIPIEGTELVNGEPQKKFEEILSEIVITEELHNLKFTEKYNTKSFVGVKKISCIQGRYPQKLIDLWDIYDEKKTSENDSPLMFQDEQLYIAIELYHGGQDLESFVFRNAAECLAAFVQTSLALAVAEQSLEFEHRDLHWGNLLISRTRSSSIECKIDDKDMQCSTKGVQVAIIDFTLSRMSYKGYCIYNDLASDPALFTAQGNEYQFEIYRLMKNKTENNWQRFEPFTNILWLHYMIDKMINMVNYKVEKKCAKMHRTYMAELEALKDVILNYESAYDFVNNCDKICDILNTNAI